MCARYARRCFGRKTATALILRIVHNSNISMYHSIEMPTFCCLDFGAVKFLPEFWSNFSRLTKMNAVNTAKGHCIKFAMSGLCTKISGFD